MTRRTNSIPVPKCAWINSRGQIKDINTSKELSLWFVATLLLYHWTSYMEINLGTILRLLYTTWTIILLLSFLIPEMAHFLFYYYWDWVWGFSFLFYLWNFRINHLHNYFYKSVWNTQRQCRPNFVSVLDEILFVLLFFKEKLKNAHKHNAYAGLAVFTCKLPQAYRGYLTAVHRT